MDEFDNKGNDEIYECEELRNKLKSEMQARNSRSRVDFIIYLMCSLCPNIDKNEALDQVVNASAMTI